MAIIIIIIIIIRLNNKMEENFNNQTFIFLK